MRAVELWKAPQPLLSQWSTAIYSKWRIVGNGENAPPNRSHRFKLKYLPRPSTEFPHLLQQLFTGSLWPRHSLKNKQENTLRAIMQRMPSIGSDFTSLEQAVLRAICETHVADRSALEAQLSTATVLRRENTGAGFYTDFSIERASHPAIGGERMRSGPAAKVDGLKQGMGFILWLKEGYVHHLEGYSYGESTTEIDFEQTEFEILHD